MAAAMDCRRGKIEEDLRPQQHAPIRFRFIPRRSRADDFQSETKSQSLQHIPGQM